MEIRSGNKYPILQFVRYGRWTDLSEDISKRIYNLISIEHNRLMNENIKASQKQRELKEIQDEEKDQKEFSRLKAKYAPSPNSNEGEN